MSPSSRLLLSIIVLLLSLGLFSGTSQAESPDEYQVKGAFLYHFANFVVWPESTFEPTDGHLRICILGKDPFGQILDDNLESKKAAGHPFQIRRNPSKQDIQYCHMLYVTNSRPATLQELSRQKNKGNVLTIGEARKFIQQGGMVQFFVDNQKVRFAVNPDAVKQTELAMSSKLLRLAKIVSP